MPNERISMSKLKQLIGLQTSNLSVRELARALGLSIGAVSKYQRLGRAATPPTSGRRCRSTTAVY
jgi:transcriptional regulator with XRE-family HTH domain